MRRFSEVDKAISDKEIRKDEIGLVLATVAEMLKENEATETNKGLESRRRALESLVHRLYGDKGMYYLSTLDYEDHETRNRVQLDVIESIAQGKMS